MKKDVIPVIFRMERNRQTREESCLAVFPTMKKLCNTRVVCYAHFGQHDTCVYDYYIHTKPATKEQYKDLLNELHSIGYKDLRVYKRWFSFFDR